MTFFACHDVMVSESNVVEAR